jgi:hypothetical protein
VQEQAQGIGVGEHTDQPVGAIHDTQLTELGAGEPAHSGTKWGFGTDRGCWCGHQVCRSPRRGLVPACPGPGAGQQWRRVGTAVEFEFGQNVRLAHDPDGPARRVDDRQCADSRPIMAETISLNGVSDTAVATALVMTSATVGSRISCLSMRSTQCTIGFRTC